MKTVCDFMCSIGYILKAMCYVNCTIERESFESFKLFCRIKALLMEAMLALARDETWHF